MGTRPPRRWTYPGESAARPRSVEYSPSASAKRAVPGCVRGYSTRVIPRSDRVFPPPAGRGLDARAGSGRC